MSTLIREAIIEAIEKKNLSQRKVAEDLGFAIQNFNQFLKGKRPFPLSDIERILKYLDLDILPVKKRKKE